MKPRKTIAKNFTILFALLLPVELLQAQEPPPPSEAGEGFSEEGRPDAETGEAAGPATEVDINYFYEALAPYGDWVWTTEYGYVWRPRDVWQDWRPYTYGHWIYSTQGWTWNSYFPWGWATFHYGRWGYLAPIGWIWVPGTVWAPAWVMWRISDGYAGWAPIPPGYDWGYGWVTIPVFYDFWTFVAWRNFYHHHLYHYYVPRHEVRDVFRHSYYPKNCRNQSSPACGRGPAQTLVEKRGQVRVDRVGIENLARTTTNPAIPTQPLGLIDNRLQVFKPSFTAGPERLNLEGLRPSVKPSVPPNQFDAPSITRTQDTVRPNELRTADPDTLLQLSRPRSPSGLTPGNKIPFPAETHPPGNFPQSTIQTPKPLPGPTIKPRVPDRYPSFSPSYLPQIPHPNAQPPAQRLQPKIERDNDNGFRPAPSAPAPSLKTAPSFQPAPKPSIKPQNFRRGIDR